MNTELMYVVIDNTAIAIDFAGTPIQCQLLQQDDIEYVDWDSADPIDWLDLTPDQYQIYKHTVDFLHQFTQQPMYIK
jgi:hypothetical protein